MQACDLYFKSDLRNPLTNLIHARVLWPVWQHYEIVFWQNADGLMAVYILTEWPASHSFLLLSFSAALYQVCITRWHQTPSMHSVPLTAIAKYGCGPARCGRPGGRQQANSITRTQRHSFREYEPFTFWQIFHGRGEKYPYKEHFHYMYTTAPDWWTQDVRMYEWFP